MNFGDSFASALSQGLGQSVPTVLQERYRRKNTLADQDAQRAYLAQQKNDQRDWQSQESRNRMAEAFLLQTPGVSPGAAMDALPYASSPAGGAGDQLREYLSNLGPQTPNAPRGAFTPAGAEGVHASDLSSANRGKTPFPGMSAADATGRALGIEKTLGSPRDLTRGRSIGGKLPTFDEAIKAAVATRNGTLPLDQLRPFTREEVKTLGMRAANSLHRPLTAQEGAILERYIGTTGGQ